MAKKEKGFEPIPPDNQKEEQKNLVVKTMENWTSDPVVNDFHGKWTEWIAWWEGDQYTYYNETINALEDVTALVDRETKNVYNRITPMIRQIWGEIRYKHQFFVEPNTTEAEDIKAAKLGSRLIEYLINRYAFQRKIDIAKLWALICGNVFLKCWWSADYPYFGYVQGNSGLTKQPGDVAYEYVNPFNVRPDPLGKDRNGWRTFIEGKLVSKSSLEMQHGLPIGTLPATETSRAEGEVYLFERENFDKPKENRILRLERWERESEENPKGRFTVTAGGWILYDGDSPAANAEIPYFHLKGMLPILDEMWGDSMVRLAQDNQRQLNRLCSQVDEIIENYKPKNLIPFGSLRANQLRAYKRVGVDFVEYNPRAGTPHWQNPPGVSSDLLNWVSRQEAEIETATSVRKVSYAQLPKYATRASGVLFEGLKRQDEIVLYPAVEDMDSVLEEMWSYALRLAQKNYTEERIIRITGKNKKTSVSTFKGAMLRDNTDVRVKPGVEMFSNKSVKEQVIMGFVEKGMITDPMKALELLDIKGIEEYMEEEFVDERQAHRYLETMKNKDEYIKVNEDDEYSVHYKVFNDFRKTEEFEGLPKKRQENILKRIDELKELIGMTQAPAEGAGAEETPEAGAGVPTPPGGLPPAPGAGAAETPSPEEALMAALAGAEGGGT